MAVRIIVGLITLLAIIQGLAGDPIGGGILTLLLVILGLVYGGSGGRRRGRDRLPGRHPCRRGLLQA